MAIDVLGDIGSYQGGADFIGFKRADLFIQGTYLNPFFIGQGGPVQRMGQMVKRKLVFSARIDDATEAAITGRQGHALNRLRGRDRASSHQSIFFNTGQTLANIRGWAWALGCMRSA